MWPFLHAVAEVVADVAEVVVEADVEAEEEGAVAPLAEHRQGGQPPEVQQAGLLEQPRARPARPMQAPLAREPLE